MKSAGFTLIEVLVVIVIMGILMGIIGPSYMDFQEKQHLSQSVKELETSLGQAFSSARSKPKIFGVSGIENETKVTLFSCDYPTCTTKEEKVLVFEPGVSLASSYFEIKFMPPQGNIDPSSFSEATLEISLKNEAEKKLRIYKNSGLIELLP